MTAARSGKIELEWADMQGAGSGGKHVFRLPIAQLEELQERCDAGPQQILRRLIDGSWRVKDVTETIRLALIGGGMPPVDAAKLVMHYVSDGALGDNVFVAQAAIMAAITSPDDEKLKKKRRAKPATPQPTTAETSSPSDPSTSSAPH